MMGFLETIGVMFGCCDQEEHEYTEFDISQTANAVRYKLMKLSDIIGLKAPKS